LLLAVVVLSACARPSLTVVADEPWWRVHGDRVLAAFEDRGSRFVEVLFASSPGEVPEVLGRVRSASVFLSPPLAWAVGEIAPRFPDIDFLAAGRAGRSGSRHPNVTMVSIDRGPAFREAGRTLARLTAADAASPLAGARTGVLALEAFPTVAEETAAFLAGLGADAPAPVIRYLPSAADRSAITAAVREMKAGGVGVFLLDLLQLTPAALDAVTAEEAKAVVPDWRSAGPYRTSVLLSIEEEWGTVLAAVVAGADRPTGGSLYVNPAYSGWVSATASEAAPRRTSPVRRLDDTRR
jgi:hypothetical protein